MKTRTVTLRLELPVSDAEVLRGLETLDTDPDLAAADRRLTEARATLARAQHDFEQRERALRELPARITRGEAVAGQLDSAHIGVRSAAALIVAAQDGVTHAEADRSRALTAAQDRALAIVTDRFAILARADQALVAQLNALDEAYDAMTAALARLCLDLSRGLPDARYDLPRPGELPNRARRVLRTAAMLVDRRAK